jgi:hypothetical protein
MRLEWSYDTRMFRRTIGLSIGELAASESPFTKMFLAPGNKIAISAIVVVRASGEDLEIAIHCNLRLLSHRAEMQKQRRVAPTGLLSQYFCDHEQIWVSFGHWAGMTDSRSI